MDETLLRRQRQRIHGIVEGALLGDIAIVFLIMRVYLPVPVVRTLLRTLACVPLVMLVQRRGIKVALLAAIASYVLFSALVGPILGLSAIDIAVAAILIGIGRKMGLSMGWNTLWTGPVYAVLDLILPTIASIYIFRYPVNDIIKSAKNFVHLVFNGQRAVLERLHAPASMLADSHRWEVWAVDHWVLIWLIIMLLYGLLNMYLVAIVSYTVLNQMPEQTLARQSVAA